MKKIIKRNKNQKEDGVLVNLRHSGVLNARAKFWKRHLLEFYLANERIAGQYWRNDPNRIIDEINIQADAFAKVPHGFDNEYIGLHTTEFGTVNFINLLLSHCYYQISLEEFLIINHGRYKKIDYLIYQVDELDYYFQDDGEFWYSDMVDE